MPMSHLERRRAAALLHSHSSKAATMPYKPFTDTSKIDDTIGRGHVKSIFSSLNPKYYKKESSSSLEQMESPLTGRHHNTNKPKAN